MPDRILRTEERPLSEEDLVLLKEKKKKQFLYLLSGYLPLIACCLYILFFGPDSLNYGRNELNRVSIDDDMKSLFWTVAPYFLGFMFTIINIYFLKLYFQLFRPLLKDIKLHKKNLLFYKPVKSPMVFFGKYYLSTPLYQNQQVEISQKDFESISDDAELCIEIAPNSIYIFRLTNGNEELQYY